jgi:NAD(P)-dependent dehydrogenase (short-subunit alcohol dehydrogenase family)
MDPLLDRVAVVTGGAGGIGLAMARAFAERGASIVLADLDETGLEKAAKELAPIGRPVLGVKTDVSKLDSVKALAEAARKRFGAVHILCNNAGVAVFGEMKDASHRDWEYVMNVDFWGVVHGVEAFVPILIEQKQGGHIVNTASMAGLVGMHWLGVYSAAKFAVVGLSEALHRELKQHSIGVSVLCPMIVETDLNANSARWRPDELRNPGEQFIPPSAAMAGGVIPKEEVARRVVRGIERGDLYILTHPEQRDILRRRAKKLDSMFEDGTW